VSASELLLPLVEGVHVPIADDLHTGYRLVLGVVAGKYFQSALQLADWLIHRNNHRLHLSHQSVADSTAVYGDGLH